MNSRNLTNRPQNVSYKLDIYIKPNWDNVLKKLDKILERKIPSSLIENQNSQYYFTEYYDSVSGLVTRFKKVNQNKKEYFSTVDELKDASIWLDIDEEGITLHHDNDSFFYFPLNIVFYFLIQLGQMHPELPSHIVFKWPKYIEDYFLKLGISQDLEWDEGNIFDFGNFGKEYEDFFLKIGEPCISKYDVDKFQLFKGENDTLYGIKLKLFQPGENNRLEEPYSDVYRDYKTSLN